MCDRAKQIDTYGGPFCMRGSETGGEAGTPLVLRGEGSSPTFLTAGARKRVAVCGKGPLLMQCGGEYPVRTCAFSHFRMDIRQLVTKDYNEEEETKAFIRTENEKAEPARQLHGDQLDRSMGQPQSEHNTKVLYELEKPFFCDRCLSSFTTRKSLRVHVSTVHLKEKPYACGVCGRTFGTRSSMRRHHQTKHPFVKAHDMDGDDESTDRDSHGGQNTGEGSSSLR